MLVALGSAIGTAIGALLNVCLWAYGGFLLSTGVGLLALRDDHSPDALMHERIWVGCVGAATILAGAYGTQHNIICLT